MVALCGAIGESLKHTSLKMDLHAAEDNTRDYSNYSFDTRTSSTPLGMCICVYIIFMYSIYIYIYIFDYSGMEI